MSLDSTIAEFGRTLARIRHHRNLTGPQIEHSHGIARSTLSRIETRGVDPHLSTLLVIAAAYDCSFVISAKGIVTRGTRLTALLKGEAK